MNFIIKLKDIHCGENTFKWPNLICKDNNLKNDIFKQIIMENIIKASSLILKYYISFLLRFYDENNKPFVDKYIGEEFGGIKKNRSWWVDEKPIIENLFCPIFSDNVSSHFYGYNYIADYIRKDNLYSLRQFNYLDKEDKDIIIKFLTKDSHNICPFDKDIYNIISNGKIWELGFFLKDNKEKIIFTNKNQNNVLKLDLTVRNKEGVEEIYVNILKCLDKLKEKRKNIEIYLKVNIEI